MSRTAIARLLVFLVVLIAVAGIVGGGKTCDPFASSGFRWNQCK